MTKDYSSLDILNWNIHWVLNKIYILKKKKKKRQFGSESAVLSLLLRNQRATEFSLETTCSLWLELKNLPTYKTQELFPAAYAIFTVEIESVPWKHSTNP